MAPYSVQPRLDYRTIEGVNGPLVILENAHTGVSPFFSVPRAARSPLTTPETRALEQIMLPHRPY